MTASSSVSHSPVGPSVGEALIGEVISIGDEMTSGARLDTNAQWLSRRLGELGIDIQFHSTVGDSLANNIDVFRIAANRADVIVCTGGLGPTRDDLTREALAALVGKPLVIKLSAMKHIESMFAQRKREMPERNRTQAMFPEGSDEIFNPQGTAPGVDVTFVRPDDSTSRIFALPGVPAEMKQMFDDTVAPRIMETSSGANHIRHHVMKFFGTGESDMEERLGEMIDRRRSPRVGITVSAATISLRISATGATPESCQAQIDATRAEILDRVSEFYFGDGESFEQYHAIEKTLTQRDEALAIIELGLAAPLGDWFASLGESTTCVGGLSFARASEITRLLGTADLTSAITTLRTNSGADWTLMVDGYPSLDASCDKPLPATPVEFVVTDPGGATHRQTITLGGHPSIVHARIAKAAMAFLRGLLASREVASG